MNPVFFIDFYKVGHVIQYPRNVTKVYSNWTPRSTRLPDQEDVVFFGLNYFIKKYLIDAFENDFFNENWNVIKAEYCEVMRATLGVKNPKVDHIEALHNLGYLPLKIYALPEGTRSPLNVPQMVVTNTRPEFYWLPNYLETILSCILWKPSTSATKALRYRRIFEKYAKQSGEEDLSFVDWQGHDFSMRGMSGVEDAILSGMGHLTCFSGTDSVPAILAAKKYYGAELTVGGSVPATEHSVMSAGGKADEFGTFKRLITETYPTGILSIVSDTWDLWKVLTDFIPRLREKILARDGKIVIRPDSGDPVLIVCGNNNAMGPEREGVLRLLKKALGSAGGTINNGAVIYGDSISEERADAILNRCVNEIGLSSRNCVFGLGSYTYEYVTRDTHGFAMKATAVVRDGNLVPIYKDPVTDDGGKKSHKGIVVADWHKVGKLKAVQECQPAALKNCAFEKVYEDGMLLVDPSFDIIRKRVRS